jgi:hypothetical protein
MKNEFIIIGVLILVLILGAAFLIGAIDFYKKNIEQGDARKFVMDELKSKYPLADSEIVSVEEKTSEKGKYYEIKAKVTQEAAGPCPERMHIYFNYPMQNFVSQPPEYITKDCKILCQASPCPILFKEEAIIASHTLPGTEGVNDYIATYKAAFPVVDERKDSWMVKWDSPLSASYYEIEISKNSTIISQAQKKKAND